MRKRRKKLLEFWKNLRTFVQFFQKFLLFYVCAYTLMTRPSCFPFESAWCCGLKCAPTICWASSVLSKAIVLSTHCLKSCLLTVCFNAILCCLCGGKLLACGTKSAPFWANSNRSLKSEIIMPGLSSLEDRMYLKLVGQISAYVPICPVLSCTWEWNHCHNCRVMLHLLL